MILGSAAAVAHAAPPAYAAANSAVISTSGWLQADSGLANDVMKRLDKKQFKNVKATADGNGLVTLTGTVDLYEYKNDADKRAHKAKGVAGVRNEIEVTGPTVSDAQLQQKLTEKLQYDRVGYGQMFDAISCNVQNGVVTLGGHARTDVDKDSALALASTTPGVKDVVDNIEVDPVSIMDDQTRIAVARAVYGTPALQKYATDPARPIRISVQNGHVELAGVVDSEADKDMANIKANQVPGVFSVKNDLQVAGGATGEKAR
ncbi:BON domain-containing protein [Acidobacteria bacterium AB60]|nr:BON domain-containing protein [Acidobacteria bacterium AB60]